MELHKELSSLTSISKGFLDIPQLDFGKVAEWDCSSGVQSRRSSAAGRRQSSFTQGRDEHTGSGYGSVQSRRGDVQSGWDSAQSTCTIAQSNCIQSRCGSGQSCAGAEAGQAPLTETESNLQDRPSVAVRKYCCDTTEVTSKL